MLISAIIYSNPGTYETKIVDVVTPEPGLNQVLIKLTHSGVCHSDFAICTNSWAHLPYPTPVGQIGGHEGVGVIEKLGQDVTSLAIGQRVGIKWAASACLNCRVCLIGKEALCSKG